MERELKKSEGCSERDNGEGSRQLSLERYVIGVRRMVPGLVKRVAKTRAEGSPAYTRRATLHACTAIYLRICTTLTIDKKCANIF